MFSLTRFSALASGDILPAIDVSNSSQNAHGSLLSITITDFFSTIPVPVNVTSASATSLAVGLAGATNSAFVVDSSTATQAAGLKVVGAVAAGTVAVVVISSGADANLTVNAKGTGTIGIGTVSTGRVTITPVTTITGSLTLSAALIYGGVTLSNAVTGTGNMVLSASPTLTGTITVTGATITGLTAASVGAGTFPAGAFVFAGAVSGITTLAGTGAVSGFTTATLSSFVTAAGVRSTSNPAYVSGTGVELQHDGTTGIVVSYDRTGAAYKALVIDGLSTTLKVSGSAMVAVTSALTTISSTTTAVQALTATNSADKTIATLIGNTANGYGMEIRGQGGSTKYNWFVGAQVTVDNGLEFIPSTAADGHTFTTPAFSLTRLGAGSFLAGISATTGTFSTSAKTASGSQSIGNAATVTLFTAAGAGSYLVSFYDAGGTNNNATAIIFWDGANTPTVGQIITNGSVGWAVPGGGVIQASNNTGSTRTFNWFYIRINA